MFLHMVPYGIREVQLFPNGIYRKTGAEVEGIMNIDILCPGAEVQIAELIELKDKFVQFFFWPLLDVAEVKECFLDNLFLVTCCFDEFEISVLFFASPEVYYA